jgi:hypothetical protein
MTRRPIRARASTWQLVRTTSKLGLDNSQTGCTPLPDLPGRRPGQVVKSFRGCFLQMRFASRSRERLSRFGWAGIASRKWGARDIIIVAVSALALVLCTAYVPVAASEQASASIDSVTYTNGKRAVVYGKITRRGHGLAGAQVQIFAPNGRLAASARSNRLGLYRVAFAVKRAKYTIVLRKSPRSRVHATVRYRLVRGIHLRVSARLTTRGFFFLPFFHY